MNHDTQMPTTAKTVDTLNELLRGELSAVESYDKAMPAIEAPRVMAELEDCRASHEERAERIRAAIVAMGGEPARAAGAWGVFAKVITSSSRALGWKTVISALEEGEDHGLEEYKNALGRLDTGTQRLVSDELYPQQVRTHGVLAALKRAAKPSS